MNMRFPCLRNVSRAGHVIHSGSSSDWPQGHTAVGAEQLQFLSQLNEIMFHSTRFQIFNGGLAMGLELTLM